MNTLPLIIDSHSHKALYLQLYSQIRTLITNGTLRPNQKLPSKRALAGELLLSVNTVDTAYQMLAAEGYIKSKPKSGFTVCQIGTLAATPKPKPNLAIPKKEQSYRYKFYSAGIDSDLFPFVTYRRIWRESSQEYFSLWGKGNPFGDMPLRQAICDYLTQYRAVQCSAANLVVGAGSEYLIGLLARLFADRCVAVENPGYPTAAKVFANQGNPLCFVPVDQDGLNIKALEQSGALLAYVTPSHQFPTGVSMPMANRRALLSWAAQGRYIIEDDHDSEFRYDIRPLPSLQGQDKGEHVIYMGTFSRSIAPSVRIAYMVLPHSLMADFDALFGSYACTVSRLEQQALSTFLNQGHFARHLNRQRVAYKSRRDQLIVALKQCFGDDICIGQAHTGLYLPVQFLGAKSETQLVQKAAEGGVLVKGLTHFLAAGTTCHQPPTLILGFASFKEDEILPAVQALKQAISS